MIHPVTNALALNQFREKKIVGTFRTALHVMECGVMPRPPMAVASARISRQLPAWLQLQKDVDDFSGLKV